ncbi:hypothetical protein GBA52_015006 [Prunus armeniaca]|nr:hypothetical protein GBA52_015006 [Prunus armeniaca]
MPFFSFSLSHSHSHSHSHSLTLSLSHSHSLGERVILTRQRHPLRRTPPFSAYSSHFPTTIGSVPQQCRSEYNVHNKLFQILDPSVTDKMGIEVLPLHDSLSGGSGHREKTDKRKGKKIKLKMNIEC